MTTHLKARIINEEATHRATKIQNDLLTTREMIAALQQEPWFNALRVINRRYESATYNDDGDPWVFFPKRTPDAEAFFKLQRLFPGIIEIQEATAEEIAEAYS